MVSVVSFRTSGAMGRDAVSPHKKAKQNGKDSPQRLDVTEEMISQGTTVDLQSSGDKDTPYVLSKTNRAEITQVRSTQDLVRGRADSNSFKILKANCC